MIQWCFFFMFSDIDFTICRFFFSGCGQFNSNAHSNAEFCPSPIYRYNHMHMYLKPTNTTHMILNSSSTYCFARLQASAAVFKHTHILSFFKHLLWQSTGQPGHWRQRQAYEKKMGPWRLEGTYTHLHS